MYRKIPKANSALYLPSERRNHRFLRNLSTAIKRLNFGNPNEYRIDDSAHSDGCMKPEPECQSRTGNYEESSESVFRQRKNNRPAVSNYRDNWQKPSVGRSSAYPNGGSSGTISDSNVDDKLQEFDKFCKEDNLKLALRTMEELEKMGLVFNLPRLLGIVKLCGEEDTFREVNSLQETIEAVQGKVRASVHHLDGNHLRYYTDALIDEFDTFCKQGKVKKALCTIDTLASMGHVVDLTRLLTLAKLCGEAEALHEAKAVHRKITSSVFHLDVNSHHVLLEMYSRCGLVNEASSVFEKMPEKNLDAWYSIIRCLAKNGQGEDAIDMFTQFKKEGNKPNGQLFRGIFYACGVLGDVDEGLLHFESMYKDYGIIPSIEHYVSIVEMYALPGFLDEALEFIERMPVEPNADVWETLMNLSQIHGDLELGDRCAEFVEELDPTRLNKQSREGFIPVKVSDVERECIKKRSGISALFKRTSKSHEYKAGDINLPENDELLELLRNLKKHMSEMGYVVETKIALHDIDPESKEDALLAHSERIAFARAVLNSAPRTTFTVFKNLRVCLDCHNALKIMADIVGRAYIMRDTKRFHHFKNGTCSCKDYW